VNILQWLFKKPKRIEYKVQLPVKPGSVIHMTKKELTSFGLPDNLYEGAPFLYDSKNDPWAQSKWFIRPLNTHKITQQIKALEKQREP
jgi:hypothetical protein